jgi:hypothetical protein
MKRLLIILLLAATTAPAQGYPSTGNEGAVRFSGSHDVVPADFRDTALPPGGEPAAIPRENKRVFSAGLESGTVGDESIGTQTEELKERMMNDREIMALITALQNDPEMQVLLSDPAVLSAVQSGDIGTLMSNPAFLKLLDNPRVKGIAKSLAAPVK